MCDCDAYWLASLADMSSCLTARGTRWYCPLMSGLEQPVFRPGNGSPLVTNVVLVVVVVVVVGVLVVIRFSIP